MKEWCDRNNSAIRHEVPANMRRFINDFWHDDVGFAGKKESILQCGSRDKTTVKIVVIMGNKRERVCIYNSLLSRASHDCRLCKIIL